MLVRDNISTHAPAAMYESFDPPADWPTGRLADWFEWHFTSKHGSWRNVAKCELGVLARRCLDRRIPDRATMTREVEAWIGTGTRPR